MALTKVALLDRTWIVHTFVGWMHSVRDAGDDWQRMGQTGPASETTHREAPVSNITVTQVCSSMLDAQSAAWQAERWERSVIAMTDDKGMVYRRVFVHEVRAEVKGCKGSGPTTQAAAKCVVELKLCVLDDE